VKRNKAKALFLRADSKYEFRSALHPQLPYSTHLNLPNIHSITILTVTKNKKITIFTINPLIHITSGVTDIIINSKSKIKKIIQKIKKRKDTGNTLTLKESKPHSNLSALINFDLIKNLPTPIIIGIRIEINTYTLIIHINLKSSPINKNK